MLSPLPPRRVLMVCQLWQSSAEILSCYLLTNNNPLPSATTCCCYYLSCSSCSASSFFLLVLWNWLFVISGSRPPWNCRVTCYLTRIFYPRQQLVVAINLCCCYYISCSSFFSFSSFSCCSLIFGFPDIGSWRKEMPINQNESKIQETWRIFMHKYLQMHLYVHLYVYDCLQVSTRFPFHCWANMKNESMTICCFKKPYK